jgi:hypothetical protein
MRVGLLLPAIVAAVFLMLVTYRFLREELVVDRCLSASHGSFDYSTMSCDLQNNHPYVSYGSRHPHDKQIALVSFVAFWLFLVGMWQTRAGKIKT